ncbi:MAG: hypothetical protein SPJ89_04350 [Treponema sp.]|nr:hypothetical protein [Spirochaetia bacterium]MDD7460575.1 hypothetical protein [Spirochaetales bacterium]MDY5811190.1 hypothetical protein [Treponema sp.]
MTTQTQPNVIYKDRLFKAIFGRQEHKDWLLSLYNALNNSDYKNPDDLELTTIENIIYITMKNDLSFLIDSQMNLYEQQSTWNPNMPLRGLFYFAQLYQQHISKQKRDIYSSTLLKIPTPQFIVIYNGSRQTADVEKLKLSDAFEVPKNDGEFEWTATLVNINKGHNESLLAKCKPLNDYAAYIERIKANVEKGLSKEEAVDEAMRFAIKNNMLNGFFQNQKMEVLNMSLTEFDQEEYDRNRYEEGREAGLQEGKQVGLQEGKVAGKLEGFIETAKKLLQINMPVALITDITGLSAEQLNKLVKA